MAIIDIFSYNGEEDLLEIRLNILNDYVDEFIICESDYTFTGLKKPRYFEENKKRFEKFLPKIKHFIMASDDPILLEEAYESPGVPKELHWWKREFTQKESMRYALTHLQDEDIVLIGDADEIWNPQRPFWLDKPPFRFKLKQTVYAYYLNNKSNENHLYSDKWLGTTSIPYKLVKTDTLDNLRAMDKHREYMLPGIIENNGWHFTNMGGTEFIKRKLNSYSHQEFNYPQIINNIENQVKENKDFIGRNFKFSIEEEDLPLYILNNKDKYGHLWKKMYD